MGPVLVLPAILLAAARDPAPAASLTLIPPSPVTERIAVDVRGAVRNRAEAARSFEMRFYLDEETPGGLLHRAEVDVPAGEARGVAFRWPAAGRAGKHRIICAAGERRAPGEAGPAGGDARASRPLDVLPSAARSPGRLGGAWVDIYHHDEGEARPFNAELAAMTEGDWRSLVRAMHAVDQDLLVITMMFQNFTHRGRHRIEAEGYRGKAYYPSRLFPGRMPIACPDPLEAILDEADRLEMAVMPGVGCYAFFDYTPASLAWHEAVAGELWERYGRHPSFYGWYVSGEKDGGLGDEEEREEIARFFRSFRARVRRLAPDKPVMLATNCYHLKGAEEAYRKLLPNLDILCPFAFHRMPAGDLTGEEAAALLRSLCDEAGCHLWMDLETFVFRNGAELHPRPIEGLVDDLFRFPDFEKTLHYQFPGLMSAPSMSRRPGGDPSVRLYEAYRRFLAEGPPPGAGGREMVHAARGRPVALRTEPDPRYPGTGAGGLVDGRGAPPEYRDRRWLGFLGADLEAVIDLGRTAKVTAAGIRCLQYAEAGIYLPPEVLFAVSDDGAAFRDAGSARPALQPGERGPVISLIEGRDLGARGRWVRVRARSFGVLPPGGPAAGVPAWLFADEVLVNPERAKGTIDG
jgi:hypothetical protein